jgi:hypothetical protein
MTSLRTVLLSLGLPSLLAAQQEATTVALLAMRADVIAVAAVRQQADPSPDVHRVLFAAGERLKGELPAAFALEEPAGRCCGRALHGLELGGNYVLFLQRRGETLTVLGGERGAVAAEAEVVAHVRALLAAADAPARLSVLSRALAAATPRLRADAAFALSTEPALPALRQAERGLVVDALRGELAGGSVLAAPLAAALCRLSAADAAQELLPTYLADRRPELRRLLASHLARLPATVVADALLVQWPQRDDERLRAAELLGCLPATAAQPLLHRLLAEKPALRVRLCAAEQLLRQGVAAETLVGEVPDAVLALARRRADTPPTSTTGRGRS